MTPADALRAERDRAQLQIAALGREFDEIVASAQLAKNDDEHDPDGTTLAYERAKTHALLSQAEATLAEIEAAQQRLDAGTYGWCEMCGDRIGADRLEAVPTTRRCIICASTEPAR